MGKRADYIWIKVSRDKYELPVAVADTATELEKLLGLAYGSIKRDLTKCKKHDMWCSYRKVYVGEETDGQ